MTSAHAIERDELMAYADGELQEARAAVVGDHLNGCDECRAFAEELGRLSHALVEWDVEPAPGLLRSRIKAAIAAPIVKSSTSIASPRGHWSWRWSVVTLSTAAIVVLIVALGSWPRERLSLSDRSDRPDTSLRPAGNPGAGGGGRGRGGAPSEDFLRSADREQLRQGQQGQQGSVGQLAYDSAPLMIRTATMALTTDTFDTVREAIERLTASHGGHIGQLDLTGAAPSPRVLRATLRIPATRLDGAMAAVRGLGRVTQESVTSEEITDRYRDLVARIANGRKEETRLVELLSRRTGDLAEVLQVEQAIARVRGEIERMDAEQRGLKGRVDLATIRVEIVERYRAEIAVSPMPISDRFRNAIVDGSRDAAQAVLAVALALTRLAPMLLVLAVAFAWPAHRLLRRLWRS